MIFGADINVLDYGATGDGITDDSAAIQLALDAGDNIVFPVGTYICVDLNLNTDQQVTIRNGAIIKLKSGSLTASKLFNINGKQNIKICGGQVDGNYAGMAAQKPEVIGISGTSSDIEISNVNFINPPDRCIGVTVATHTITDINIHDNIFDNNTNGENAVALNNIALTGTCERVSISNNIMLNVISGVRLWGISKVSITNNYIKSTASTANECIGVHVKANEIKVIGNTLETSTSNPFPLTVGLDYDSDNWVIANNVITAPGTTDTFFADAMEIVFRFNTSNKNWSITGNTISGTYYGISIGYQATVAGTIALENFTVSSNTLVCLHSGIRTLHSGSTSTCTMNGLVIDGNTVSLTNNGDSNDRCIIARDTNANQTISDCVISNNIVRNGFYGIYTDNTQGGQNVIIKDNIAEGNVYGFRFAGNPSGGNSSSAQGNIADNNSIADYLTSNFTPLLGCTRRDDRNSLGIIPPEVSTFTADDLTPSVLNSHICLTVANTGATAITQLDDGVAGQQIIICGQSNTNPSTIADSGNFKLNGAITLNLNTNINLVTHDGTTWNEISRSVN